MKIDPFNKDGLIVCSNDYPVDLKKENPKFLYFGKGYRISPDKGSTWQEAKLDSFSVLDIMYPNGSQDEMIASVFQAQRGGTLHSTDGGETWDVENFSCEGSHQIMKLLEGELNMIFGSASNTGEGFIYSDDNFETCDNTSVIYIQSRDIEKGGPGNKMLFIAGDNVYAGGVFRSSDDGKTWLKEESGLEGLRILCVLPSSKYPNVVYCGADTVTKDGDVSGKGIYVSLDTGKTWQLKAAEGASVYDMKEHPSDPDYMVAACGDSGVYVSANAGFWWDQYKDGFPENSSVRQIAVPDWPPNDEGILAYAGVYEYGIYLSGRMITDITDSKLLNSDLIIKNIFPQPFYGELNIEWFNPQAQTVVFKLSDISGRIIFKEKAVVQAGEQVFSKRFEGIDPGSYLFMIQAGENISTGYVIKAD